MIISNKTENLQRKGQNTRQMPDIQFLKIENTEQVHIFPEQAIYKRSNKVEHVIATFYL